jgi:hypothetical protein
MTKHILGAQHILGVLCVLAAAATPAAAVSPDAGSAAATIAGRWQGPNYILARNGDCSGGKCTLTLDIVACGNGWCGIEVAQDMSCGGTALKLDGGESGNGSTLYKGRLELAEGTEPYIVQAYLIPAASGDGKEWLEIQGDTGGEFRVFRRSFPFNAQLARTGNAVCKTEKPVS